jgi:hypothetical protein
MSVIRKDHVVVGLLLTVDGSERILGWDTLPRPRTHPEDRVNVQEQVQALIDDWLGSGQVRVWVKSLTPTIVRVYPL